MTIRAGCRERARSLSPRYIYIYESIGAPELTGFAWLGKFPILHFSKLKIDLCRSNPIGWKYLFLMM